MADLTILTRPVYSKAMTEVARTVHGLLGLAKGRPWPKSQGSGGHPAVVRSLLEGLKQLGSDFNVNPTSLDQLAPTVVVVSGIGALRQAINLRRSGRIAKLLAGPNLVILPTDFGGLVTAPEIDLYLLNSPWTREMYERVAPTLRGRTRLFPSGVDADWWWDGPKAHDPRRLLFYDKRPPRRLFERCIESARQAGFEVEVIRYGHYNALQFREALHRTGVMVCWAEQESQGIATLEAWAADVPTLVWNPGSFLWENANYDSDSCPYLTPATGRRFHDLTSFRALLGEAADRSRYRPRQWVLEHLADAKSAQILLDIVAGKDPVLPNDWS